MPRTKRLYYGPWKLRRHEPVSQIVIRPGMKGDPQITIESYKEWERMIGRGVPWSESRKEERDSITLRQLVEKLSLKDVDSSLLQLLVGGVETIFKLADTYQWYLRREEEKQKKPENIEKERRRRERERKADQRYRAERKAEEKKKRLQERREKKEKAERERKYQLEQKAKEAEARAQKKKFEEQLKKDAADKKRKEEEEALLAKQYTDSWLNPPGRRIELDA